MLLAGELAHQPVREIVEIVQAVAQERIGLPQHAGARVGLDAFDGGLRREPGHDGFVQAAQPAAVGGEHAVGLEHVAMLAAGRHVAALEHHVEVRLQRIDRLFEPPGLALDVIGDVVGDDDARLVQHHVAERDPVRKRQPGQVQGTPDGGFEPGLGERRELARGDHLGQHNRDGLERLLLFLRVGAPRPVLHHQDAQRIAGAQDRDAEEGVIDLLAGLRPV